MVAAVLALSATQVESAKSLSDLMKKAQKFKPKQQSPQMLSSVEEVPEASASNAVTVFPAVANNDDWHTVSTSNSSSTLKTVNY